MWQEGGGCSRREVSVWQEGGGCGRREVGVAGGR